MTLHAVDKMARPPAPTRDLAGLTSAQADRRRAAQGGNAVPDVGDHPLARVLDKFWSPVPWMLEGAIVLELALV
jgi:H+-transporting ATPase